MDRELAVSWLYTANNQLALQQGGIGDCLQLQELHSRTLTVESKARLCGTNFLVHIDCVLSVTEEFSFRDFELADKSKRT